MMEMQPLEQYLRDFGDTDDTRETYYLTYLGQTDYIPLKLAEAPNARSELEKEYELELAQREKCREEIRKIRAKRQEKEDNNEPSTGNAG